MTGTSLDPGSRLHPLLANKAITFNQDSVERCLSVHDIGSVLECSLLQGNVISQTAGWLVGLLPSGYAGYAVHATYVLNAFHSEILGRCVI